MPRFLFLLSILALLTPYVSLAQSPEAAEVVNNDPAVFYGQMNCFDWYSPDSVKIELPTNLSQTVPGATLTFNGEVVNNNSYPLVDGTLYAKFFKVNESTYADGDGNEVIDQFIVAKSINIPAESSIPVSYDWTVPRNAEGGEYYAAYFFNTSDRFDLTGLPFKEDAVSPAYFEVVATNTVSKLSKTDTALNGRDYHFNASPLHFDASETITISTTITNQTDQEKKLPLQLKEYAGNRFDEDNLRNTETELIVLAPNETKVITYTVKEQRESVGYITAVTEDMGVKSLLNISYVRDGIEGTQINFAGLSDFPLKEGEEATVFACAQSTNLPGVPGNTITLTLTGRDGEIVHQYRYEGDIVSAIGGFGESFVPTKAHDYLLLTATLERDGEVTKEIHIEYDCKDIDQGQCLTEDRAFESLFSMILNNTLWFSAGIVILLLLLFLVWSVHKRHKNV